MPATNSLLSSSSEHRRLQLDGLRWFAVLGVMVSHYLDPHQLYGNFGGWGVQTFFVLSGFLIGGILLRARERIANGTSPISDELKNFYARRTLRIFPAFYLLVGLTFLLGNWSSAPFVWISLYAVNIWEVAHCEVAGVFGHLYTLCIEEHFYLFFPFLVFAFARKYANILFSSLIIFSVLYRLLIVDTGYLCNGSRLVFAELDSLAGGALVANLVLTGRLSRGNALDRTFTALAAVCGILFFANFYVIKLAGTGIKSSAVTGIFFAVVACWLVYRASFGFSGFAGKMLSWRPFVYLGTISYGIYLYHNFAGWFVANATLRLGWSEPLPVAISFVLQVLWTIGAASLGWWLLEEPCNRMKRYFEYKSQSAC